MSKKRVRASVTVSLTTQALSDLRDIEKYSVQKWGRATTNRYLDALQSGLDRLKERPDLLRAEPGLSSCLFFYRVRKHFFVCDLQSQSLCVLAVIHTSMDIPTRLAELVPRLELEVELLHQQLHP